MKSRLFIVLLCACTLTAAGGPLLKKQDLPGWDISSPDTYSAKELYGYINGGAELYLEYGFTQVAAQRCSKGKQEIQVDIYEMVSPEAAFGMFSMLRGECSGALTGAAWSCARPEQILFARDRYLVSVVPYDRANDTRATAMKAAAALLRHIGGEDYRPPQAFRSGELGRSSGTLRYLRGPLALQAALSGWGDWLEGIGRFDLHHCVVGSGSGRTEAAVLKFRSKRDADRFLAKAGFSGAGKAGAWVKHPSAGAYALVKGGKTVHYLRGGNAVPLQKQLR